MSQLRIKIGRYYNFTIDKEPAMNWVIRLSPFWEGEGRSYLLQRLSVAIQRGIRNTALVMDTMPLQSSDCFLFLLFSLLQLLHLSVLYKKMIQTSIKIFEKMKGCRDGMLYEKGCKLGLW